ncbi:hypothetical protein Rsub_12973 [Raphidocelis subcapitata]|uniref:Uncharacterized protein n=1 Tax=Raphidocelis subcapitata TaxID=307507 RepID=A0A2V0PPQ0_9CHLO|nr:hypothetical protein Rsub_12973 [Raphidocelis subcapitata]|eukprot:GBG00154.1 hypothetical protein Rsub_12973 [Raphidocelis subcapitata]
MSAPASCFLNADTPACRKCKKQCRKCPAPGETDDVTAYYPCAGCVHCADCCDPWYVACRLCGGCKVCDGCSSGGGDEGGDGGGDEAGDK